MSKISLKNILKKTFKKKSTSKSIKKSKIKKNEKTKKLKAGFKTQLKFFLRKTLMKSKKYNFDYYLDTVKIIKSYYR